MELETYTPLHGEPFKIGVNGKTFDRAMVLYRKLYPLDTREFEDMSSDVQHAIISACQE